jgi:predicted DNA-binding transcriptional regulator AlpA
MLGTPACVLFSDDRLLSVRQMAELAGISERTFWRFIATGVFPPADYRVGRLTRWRVSTFRSWLETQSPRTSPATGAVNV